MLVDPTVRFRGGLLSELVRPHLQTEQRLNVFPRLIHRTR